MVSLDIEIYHIKSKLFTLTAVNYMAIVILDHRTKWTLTLILEPRGYGTITICYIVRNSKTLAEFSSKSKEHFFSEAMTRLLV